MVHELSKQSIAIFALDAYIQRTKTVSLAAMAVSELKSQGTGSVKCPCTYMGALIENI